MDAWSRIGAALDDLEPAAIAPPAGGRIGAALVLIAETGDGDLEVVYTRRREDLSNHPGQVSFPGGGVDPGETVEEAALREANEEIGLDPATATVCGRLPPFYIPPSRFWLQAVIARWDAPHPLVGAEAEVAEILRVRLSTLRDPGVWRGVNMSTLGWSWAWQLDTEHLLWGATAMVTAALLGVVSPEWHGGAAPADLGPDRQPRPWERRAFTTARVRPARLPGLSEITEAELTAAQAAAAGGAAAGGPVAAGGPAAAGGAAAGGAAAAPVTPIPDPVAAAGAAVAAAVRGLRASSGLGRRVLVLAGGGGTGRVGLAAARDLRADGHEITVVTSGGSTPTPPRAPDASAFDGTLSETDVVVDALVGTGLRGRLDGMPLAIALELRLQFVPVVAVDVPTGLDPDRGMVGDIIPADVTVALDRPRPGLSAPGMSPFAGDVYVADLAGGGLARLVPSGDPDGWRE